MRTEGGSVRRALRLEPEYKLTMKRYWLFGGPFRGKKKVPVPFSSRALGSTAESLKVSVKCE
jgi:hypothetical protein